MADDGAEAAVSSISASASDSGSVSVRAEATAAVLVLAVGAAARRVLRRRAWESLRSAGAVSHTGRATTVPLR